VPLPTQQVIDWQWANGSGYSERAQDTPQIHSVVEGGRTYVLADLPRAIATTAQLEVDRSGLDPVVVPFNDVSADLDRTLAAFAFSEAARFTARIVAADGTVLATWPQ